MLPLFLYTVLDLLWRGICLFSGYCFYSGFKFTFNAYLEHMLGSNRLFNRNLISTSASVILAIIAFLAGCGVHFSALTSMSDID